MEVVDDDVEQWWFPEEDLWVSISHKQQQPLSPSSASPRVSSATIQKGEKVRSIEQQVKWLLLVRVPVLELLPRQPFGKWHHSVLHVHDTSLLLVDVRSVNDNAF